MLISIICNLDSRSGIDERVTQFQGMNEGARSWDFFTAGLWNKLRFFSGFDVELLVFIDEHLEVPNITLNEMRCMADCITIRKHTKRYRDSAQAGYSNDINYLHALSQARGEIIAHFDADTAAFTSGLDSVNRLIKLLDQFRFVSYPSQWSPVAVEDASFKGRTWASTRFFLCMREHIKLDVLERALRDPEWAYNTFGQPARRCPWMEHFLSLTNNESVFYPLRDDHNLLIFCWDRYHSGLLQKLNELPFDQVSEYISGCGGIHYPNDVTATL